MEPIARWDSNPIRDIGGKALPLTANRNLEMIDETSEVSMEIKMDEILTIEEIEARYAPEYVLIGDPTTDEYMAVRSGRVLFHSMDREEVTLKVREYPPGRYALRYLGSFPDDMALVL
jgi:hypothetical protein